MSKPSCSINTRPCPRAATTAAAAATGATAGATTPTEESLPTLVATLDPVDWSVAFPPVPVVPDVCCSLLIPLLVLVVVVIVVVVVTFPAVLLAPVAMDDDDVDAAVDTVDIVDGAWWLLTPSPPRCARSKARSANTCLLTARRDGGVGGMSTPTSSLDAALTSIELSRSLVGKEVVTVGVVMVASLAAGDDREKGGVEVEIATEPAGIGIVGLAGGVA